MNSKKGTWLRISGICGIMTPLVALVCISLAITYSPQFSWTENALSDLGIQEGITAPLFNYGLIISGFLALIFAKGIFSLMQTSIFGKIGATAFILDTITLIAIGVFPENAKPMHFYASVIFFLLFPISMFILTAALLRQRQVKTGLFTLAVAMIAATPWVALLLVRYVQNVAIPETISALAASTWAILLGVKMLKQTSHSNG